jgi:type I restriction enzyme S subunit
MIPQTTLRSVTRKIGSGATPRGGSTVYRTGGVSFIRSQNVLDNRMKVEDVARLAADAAHELRGVTVEAGDVLLNITGDSIARCCLVDEAILPARVSQHVAIIRTNDQMDPRFLQRALVNPAMKESLLGMSSGGTRNALTKAMIEELEVPCPDMPIQRAIAEVLGALDDKIAANTDLISTAGSLAVSIAETFDDMTPLVEVVTHHKHMVSPESVADRLVEHYSLPAFDASNTPEEVAPSMIKSGKFSVDQPCVLVSKLNPRFPRIWDVPAVGPATALASTEFLVLESRYSTPTVLWAVLSQPSFSASLETQVAGTSGSHQRVKPADLLSTAVIDPRSMSDSAKDKITSLGQSIASYRQESRKLAALRDALLPELISGRLRVPDAVRVVGREV